MEQTVHSNLYRESKTLLPTTSPLMLLQKQQNNLLYAPMTSLKNKLHENLPVNLNETCTLLLVFISPRGLVPIILDRGSVGRYAGTWLDGGYLDVNRGVA